VGDREFDNEEMLTARLSLRRPTPTDIDVIYSIHRDPRACAHNPADMLATRADAEDLYRRWDEHWQRHGFGYWVIRPRQAREPLGFCGIKLMQFKDRKILNLLYRLDPSVWGNGLATEAATAVLGWATTQIPDHPSPPRQHRLPASRRTDRTPPRRTPRQPRRRRPRLDLHVELASESDRPY